MQQDAQGLKSSVLRAATLFLNGSDTLPDKLHPHPDSFARRISRFILSICISPRFHLPFERGYVNFADVNDKNTIRWQQI